MTATSPTQNSQMLALADVSFTAIGYAKSERRQVQTVRQRLALTEENRHQREMHGVESVRLCRYFHDYADK